MELIARNVNEAFGEIFWKLNGLKLKPERTRNGPALVFPDIVTTIYKKPAERVLFHAGRDANPIFHLMESIWMLAGRDDVKFLTQFNRRMVDFSDDAVRFNAAYGYRWRNHFGHDQLQDVIRMLRRDPSTRQAVVQIWDNADLTKNTRDKACNTQIVFDIRNGGLNMTVFNRSNDIWWGAYGANAVHFSVLQELVASAVGAPIGVYRQVSNNFHLYTELYDAAKYVDVPPLHYTFDYYGHELVRPRPLMLHQDYEAFLKECSEFCENPYENRKYTHSFFNEVAVPMAMVSKTRRSKDGDGMKYAKQIEASDWRCAVEEWIERREAKKAKG